MPTVVCAGVSDDYNKTPAIRYLTRIVEGQLKFDSAIYWVKSLPNG